MSAREARAALTHHMEHHNARLELAWTGPAGGYGARMVWPNGMVLSTSGGGNAWSAIVALADMVLHYGEGAALCRAAQPGGEPQ